MVANRDRRSSGRLSKPGKFIGREVATLDGEGLLAGLAQPFQLHQPAVRGQRQTRGGFLLVFDDAGAQDPRARRQTAAGHLFGKAGQAVEVDLGQRNERSGAPAAVHQAFVFEFGERVPRGHQADFMAAREFPFRRHGVSGLQFAGLDALP